MKIKIEHKDGVSILRLSRELTIGSGDVQLRRSVTDELLNGYKKILVDMKRLSYVDSAGLGELVRAYTTVRKAQGDMRLLHLMDKARQLLTMTRLITVFDHYDNEEEALKAFAEDSQAGS